MNPRLRTWLIGGLGAIGAVVMGVGIAGESYVLAGLASVGILWILAEWKQGAFFDAWLLALLLVGYLLGNRGFAQFLLLPNFPLLPAEAGLLVATPALLFRMAFKQTAAFRRDVLDFGILLWLLLGAALLPTGFREHGFMALRDFAMVYYAVFFFIGQALAQHAPSRTVLLRALTVGFVLVAPVSLGVHLVPEFFYSHFVWRGVPLFFHKSDLSAAFLACGFFWLWTRWEIHRTTVWVLLASSCLMVLSVLASPRAAMVAVAAVSFCWLIGKRPRLIIVQVAVGFVLAISLAFFATVTNRDVRNTPIYAAYEHTISIFDLHGRRQYSRTTSGDPVDNNQFRLVWWRSVIAETMDENPVFGLGFGRDLAARFLANYDRVTAEDFTARSPHSMIISVFGRMGFAGLLLWFLVAFGIARLAWRSFHGNDFDHLGLVSIALALWVSACFGVVLEGPMGAMIFWTTLGLANAMQAPAPQPVPESPESPVKPAEEVTMLS